jgi:hypothetical protein
MDDKLSLGLPSDAFEQIQTKPLQWHLILLIIISARLLRVCNSYQDDLARLAQKFCRVKKIRSLRK